jgi:hypothetical protein
VNRALAAAALALLPLSAGCGGSKPVTTRTTATTATAATTPTTTTTVVTAPPGPSALQGEAATKAAGDIPDNQVFISFHDSAFTMKYPEGWAQTGSGGNVTFRDKNNIVRVVVTAGGAPTLPEVSQELSSLHGAKVTSKPAATTVGGAPAIKATYQTTSPPNPVTGKSVTLTVDRYELASHGRRGIVDLGTPVGVDNVDAYRLMVQSLRLK